MANPFVFICKQAINLGLPLGNGSFKENKDKVQVSLDIRGIRSLDIRPRITRLRIKRSVKAKMEGSVL
jgi:hypothetical protein